MTLALSYRIRYAAQPCRGELHCRLSSAPSDRSRSAGSSNVTGYRYLIQNTVFAGNGSKKDLDVSNESLRTTSHNVTFALTLPRDAFDSVITVSYTHLTLPTNREV